ncbi:Methyltransferase domain-containing protein [Nocardia amikacinitolerans]|uniref:Methyltransferase domain-containing protein n=1 Tax=Nocardia amikacinitolerans TaxID=756689 RepID=A0A285KWK3_9NOCA|nr:class I SAM-dependent methyltransferase [Nocardia amikacinitolerans]MCP2314898.1 Methyltransferase domain-containing protein [Nocardia amikacinitolerans]SNY76623.1 Methyltransferase domain-containing protein [Nocardia amikacinitolerans]
MSSRLDAEYADPTPLRVRIDTHERYSEKPHDPGGEVLAALALSGAEYLADVGCGDARFLARLVAYGHRGPLLGIDTSPAMVAAAQAVPGVRGVRADARRIPFDDNTFDVLTARHMLYHVPDPAAALHEFRRTTKPGGTVAVVVNHPETCPYIGELVDAHAASYGIEPDAAPPRTVDSETLPRLMSDIFGDVRVQRCDNALVFDSPAPLIRFAEAIFGCRGIEPDHPDRDAILADLSADVEDWFVHHPGRTWRDPKGYLVATALVAE